MITANESPRNPGNQPFSVEKVRRNTKSNSWYRKPIQTNNVQSQVRPNRKTKGSSDLYV